MPNGESVAQECVTVRTASTPSLTTSRFVPKRPAGRRYNIMGILLEVTCIEPVMAQCYSVTYTEHGFSDAHNESP